jgi:hypothetical protein
MKNSKYCDRRVSSLPLRTDLLTQFTILLLTAQASESALGASGSNIQETQSACDMLKYDRASKSFKAKANAEASGALAPGEDTALGSRSASLIEDRGIPLSEI